MGVKRLVEEPQECNLSEPSRQSAPGAYQSSRLVYVSYAGQNVGHTQIVIKGSATHLGISSDFLVWSAHCHPARDFSRSTMTAVFPSESLQVVSGITTAWLPVPTPWLSIAACSSQIYEQRAGLGGNFIAFDPLYGESIVPSAIPCLPTEVTSSWYQSNDVTTTVLGPTFACPGAYSGVQTILVNSLTQQVLCCPSQYTLNVAITGHGTFPSQCFSHFSSGQTVTYESTTPAGPWGVVTTVVAAAAASTTGPTIVWGMHVNGFNVIAAGATFQTTLSTPVYGTVTPSTTSVLSASSSTITAVSQSSTLKAGATAGIAVACTLAVVAAIIAAWFVFRRRRDRRIHPPEYTVADPPDPQEMEVPKRWHEMSAFARDTASRNEAPRHKASQDTEVHEMG